MIERCTFCGDTHETGEGYTFGGMPIKVCPNIPTNVDGYRYNPKAWKVSGLTLGDVLANTAGKQMAEEFASFQLETVPSINNK